MENMYKINELLQKNKFLYFENGNKIRINISFDNGDAKADIYKVENGIIHNTLFLTNENINDFLMEYNLTEKIGFLYDTLMKKNIIISNIIDDYMSFLKSKISDENTINMFRRLFHILSTGERFYLDDKTCTQFVEGLDLNKSSFVIYQLIGESEWCMLPSNQNLFIDIILNFYQNNRESFEMYMNLKEASMLENNKGMFNEIRTRR